MAQQIILSTSICDELAALCNTKADKLFVLTDTITHEKCLPLLNGCEALKEAVHIVIGATDTHKTLDTLADVWQQLGHGGGSRHSLMICLGGGMVTDLGGFAASTFKRGIRFINIPTTLLAMVDAAVGGKTGINFDGLKNEIGVFNESEAVIINTQFLQTLDAENIRSGYAEMLKHALLSGGDLLSRHLDFDLNEPDLPRLQKMVAESIKVKEAIVKADPHEHGLRKALNLGHTFGHALESLALEQDRAVLHGYAVAWGLVCELYLSCTLRQFPESVMRQCVRFIRDYYGTFDFDCKAYDHLYDLMRHDKKNQAGVINFTLLNGVGDIALDCHATQNDVYEAFDFLREA
ncbi:MAG: 3-dehydroquinate synthase [Alloprevotella sp.]